MYNNTNVFVFLKSACESIITLKVLKAQSGTTHPIFTIHIPTQDTLIPFIDKEVNYLKPCQQLCLFSFELLQN